MTLDLTVFGDPPGIRSVGDWLHSPLASTAGELDVDLAYLAADATVMWTGESGEAFYSTAQAVRSATKCVRSFANNLCEVMRAFASRLERGRAFFDEVELRAVDGGLSVVGNVIHPPTTSLTYCPGPGSPAEELALYDRYLTKLRLYNDLGSAVGQWEGETEVWVYEHFGALAGDLGDLENASSVLKALRDSDKVLIDVAFETATARTQFDLATWRSHAETRAAAYEEYKRNRRSGHPGRRAAAAEAVPQDLRRAIGEADEGVHGLARASRIISGLGIVADVGVGLYDIGQGGSPSSVGVEIVAGSGAVVAVGTVTAGGPVVWVAGAAVVVGWAAGTGGKWLWETTVSLGTRESIDEGLRNFGGDLIFWDNSLRVPQ